MSDQYTDEEAQEALELIGAVMALLKDKDASFACHVLSCAMAGIIHKEVPAIARMSVIQIMQRRLAQDVVKVAEGERATRATMQ